MSDPMLKSLEISNFRSIRGHIHAPLDANVVLIHGENGAGKTSLLSAIELALTGRVQSLERADLQYVKQLLHRSASNGRVQLTTQSGASEESFEAVLTVTGMRSLSTLDRIRAAFFRERAFLPQALLGQLLQIYQEADSHASSPLAQFVGKLLGLDQLDALEAGLKPLIDIRNVRKTVEDWLTTENEKKRLDGLLIDQRKIKSGLDTDIRATVNELALLCAALQLSGEVREDSLDAIAVTLADSSDREAFAQLADRQRRLAAIRREIEAAQSMTGSTAELTPTGAEDASAAYVRWEATYGARLNALRSDIGALLPSISLPSEPEQVVKMALAHFSTDRKQLAERVAQARADIFQHAKAQDEHVVALHQRDAIDTEVAQLSSNAASFAAALAELTSFMSGDGCPVCDRDFREVSANSLHEHVHRKIQTLSASANRLSTLGRTRSEVQLTVERLGREIEALGARRLDEEALAALDRRLAAIENLSVEISGLGDAIIEGGHLRAADIAARRAVSEAHSRHVTLAAAWDTLSDFAALIGAPALTDGESFSVAAARLALLLDERSVALEDRLAKRRKGGELIETIRTVIKRRQQADSRIAMDVNASRRASQALERAQSLRSQGNAIREAVDRVRSDIIRREFNDRLNHLWRDLFVRLAPGEPFVPAFRIPQSSTQRLQPKLITEHRDGGDTGGTPGAMLSAGNLNTAALTLFIALHLAATRELPWLILDDPVQSMDDVHIAHFAALLRTLSKEHGRQIMVAVHDRQLFEYLRLELSPAFKDDSLQTLELSRGPTRDTLCVPTRYSFKEETVLRFA